MGPTARILEWLSVNYGEIDYVQLGVMIWPDVTDKRTLSNRVHVKLAALRRQGKIERVAPHVWRVL